MHYTGTIWRPPYESGSLLLEAAAGCTHHRCKFCTLYDELPFRFRLSPLEDIEADLAEAQELRSARNSLSKQVGILMGQSKKDPSKLAEAEALKAEVKAVTGK